MERYYFISDDIGEVQKAQSELLQRGVASPHVRVLSNDDAELDRRGLRSVFPFLRQDVVRSTERGALIGFGGALLVVVVAFLAGVSTLVGWIPVLFLAVILLGFGAWEGGLIGMERRNYKFERFEQALAKGSHVLMVDVEDEQRELVPTVASHYHSLRAAGTGSSAVNPLQNREH